MAVGARVRQVVGTVVVLPLLSAVLLAGCGHDRAETVGATTAAQANGAPQGSGPAPTTPEAAPSAPTDPSAAASGAGGGAGTQGPGGAGSASAAPAGPRLGASPVFQGEPCDTVNDTAPQTALGGLMLYCNPPASPNGNGSWQHTPPTPQPTGPAPGTECSTADLGSVQVDPSGRPVSCLREPNGDLRWSDIS